MSLFAGAISRENSPGVPPELVAALQERLDRTGSHAPVVFERDGAFLAKLEIGAFGEPGHHEDPDGSVSLICGEPLLHRDGGNARTDRDRDLARLHEAWKAGDHSLLRSADGVFSGAHLSADGSELILTTDHLGVRPVYVWEGEGLVIVSSTLRLLTTLPGIRRTLDEQGTLEFATLGYPLDRRTPFREISRLAPGEIVEIPRSADLHSTRFWRWEKEIPADPDPDRELDEEIYQRFRRAVRRRLGPDPATVAFLSGGLDSRAIVAVLADLGATVHTVNFSLPGTQDRVFAREFAEAADTLHVRERFTKPVCNWEGDWTFKLRDAWDASPHRKKAPVPRPRLAWSGDGGSVTTGGSANLTDPIAASMRQDELEQAAGCYSSDLPEGILPPGRRNALKGSVVSGVRQELERIDHPDPLRRFHLFLLFNNQHRHMDGHFEHIDRHRLELHLPFFDRSYLEALFRIPMKRLRKHRFYHEWLERFPEVTTSVPWQTYPGHLPCPIPHDPDLPDQWEENSSPAAARLRRNGRRIRRGRLAKMALSRSFPSDLLDRKRLLAAGLLDQTKMKDYGYVVNFAYDVFRHARATT